MRTVYLAAPLFDNMELDRNRTVCNILESEGFKVYMPQRDSGEAAMGADRKKLFVDDIQGIEQSDIVVALLDGRVPDEGTVFEMGYAYARGKEVYAILTDRRSFMNGHLNVMLEYGAKHIFSSVRQMLRYI